LIGIREGETQSINNIIGKLQVRDAPNLRKAVTREIWSTFYVRYAEAESVDAKEQHRNNGGVSYRCLIAASRLRQLQKCEGEVARRLGYKSQSSLYNGSTTACPMHVSPPFFSSQVSDEGERSEIAKIIATSSAEQSGQPTKGHRGG